MCKGNPHCFSKCQECALFDTPNYKVNCFDIKNLREITGADMIICKQVLAYTGNIKDAINFIRECGYAVYVKCFNFKKKEGNQ